MGMKEAIDSLAARAAAASHFEQGDYFDDDGLLCCHKCETPKQCKITVFDAERIVPCLCRCEAQRKADEERERKAQEFRDQCRRARQVGFPETHMQQWTFGNDDMSNPRLTHAMQNYVEHFAELKEQGKGLLLYGSVGSGKTFAACEAANALIDRGWPVLVTNFARLCNTLQGMFDGKQQYIDSLNKFSLLVIDDLAAERDTEYMQEIVYNIIDARYRAGLPMIITTNLSGGQLKNPDSLSKERIYSRLLERCHPIEVSGTDRRRAALKDSYAEMKNILGM